MNYSELNDEQKAAIKQTGDVLLIACPGSGKTRTLIHKIASTLQQIESHREFVVALTYTHVAADEVRERIDALGVDTTQLWVGTIHSFCLQWILKPYSVYHPQLQKGFTVIDILEREILLDEISKKFQLTRYDCNYHATADGYEVDQSIPSGKRDKVSQIVAEYNERLAKSQQIDFEVMLKSAYDLLAKCEQIAPRLGKMFRLIAVDEFQDTHDIQYQIVTSIIKNSSGKTSLFMVGDPNQAIYGSLGGVAYSREKIEHLTGRSITQCSLTRNYRSSKKIVDFYSHFAVSHSEIVAANSNSKWCGELYYFEKTHKNDLVSLISKLIQYNISELGVRPEEIGIVAPWWIHLASLTRGLVEALPNYDFNGPGLSPFGENRDNFWYKIARIALTEPSPELYPKRFRWAREIIDQLVDSGELAEGTEARDLLRVANDFSIDSNLGIEFLREFFSAFIRKLNIELNPTGEVYQQQESFIERTCRRIKLVRDREKVDLDDIETFRKVFRPKTGITISTIHGVKGAEFDTVIAFGLLEGIVPHFSEPESKKVNSAKRLLYVTGSRARKNLYLVSEQGRGKNSTEVLQSVWSGFYSS